MGVSGVGKSTIGHLLSKKLEIPFLDGDDFHSKDNICKMSGGLPLTDEDRYNWLTLLNQISINHLSKKGCVIVCSALKQKYRVILNCGLGDKVRWVHLSGSFSEVSNRINRREGHFMTSKLLQSQFDTLENPLNALKVDIKLKPNEIVDLIVKSISS